MPILKIKLCGKDCKIIYKEKHLLELQEFLRASDMQEWNVKKWDKEYHFEQVQVLDRDMLPIEHKAQFLSLYLLFAAMYKEF